MDFHAAATHAIDDIHAGGGPDSDAVHAGLQLAVHAWQLCDPPEATATGWAMFGNGLCAAIDVLGPPEQPIVILIDEQKLADTVQVRHHAAALATTLAARLEAASGDPHADPNRRWACSATAARLRTAADDLTNWP